MPDGSTVRGVRGIVRICRHLLAKPWRVLPRGGGHHLEHLLADGVAGFLCAYRAEFAARAQVLQADGALRF